MSKGAAYSKDRGPDGLAKKTLSVTSCGGTCGCAPFPVPFAGGTLNPQEGLRTCRRPKRVPCRRSSVQSTPASHFSADTTISASHSETRRARAKATADCTSRASVATGAQCAYLLTAVAASSSGIGRGSLRVTVT